MPNVCNTVRHAYASAVEQAVLEALNSYPGSETWTVTLKGFQLAPGFTVMVVAEGRMLGAWIFDGPGDPITSQIREDLAIVLKDEPLSVAGLPVRTDSLLELPKNLPVPVDDGSCDHLPGSAVPDVRLASTSGRAVPLLAVSRDRAVIFCYPRTGRPDRETPEGWNEVPGARGCTPQTCGYRDRFAEFRSLGVGVFGLSTQTPDHQLEMAKRLGLPFEVLSDAALALTRALRLPTFDFQGATLLRRLTLFLSGGRIEAVFYPVFPPDRSAENVLAWLRLGSDAPVLPKIAGHR